MTLHGRLLGCEEKHDPFVFKNFLSVFDRYQEPVSQESTVTIGEHIYKRKVIIEEIDILMRLVQTHWCHLQNITLYDDVPSYEEMIYSRDFINKSFCVIEDSILACQYPAQKHKYKLKTLDKVALFANSVVSINKLSDEVVLKLSTLQENDTKNPLYQYLHTFLEVQYYILIFHFICGAATEVLESRIEKLVISLIELSRRNYQRQTTRLIFGCSCTRNIWLIIQFFLEKTSDDKNSFWKIVNRNLEDADPLFSLWLLKDIASLQCYNINLQNEGNACERVKENYELIQAKIKPVLLNADSEMLMKILKLIEPLLCNVWLKNAKIEVYQTIWDYYSKRLNVSKKNYSNLNAIDLNELLVTILCSPKQSEDDFEKFIGLLIYHLRNYPVHWGKLKGRIYSQLGPNKVKDLSETGIVHVMLLYAALTTVNYEEVVKKIISFFEALSPEKKNSPLVWNIYIAFNIKQVKDGHSLEKTAPPLLSLLQEASVDHKKFRLIKGFIANFKHLLNSSNSMQLGQTIFLNSWLSNYLSNCYYADLIIALDVLLFTLDKVENPDCWSFWMNPFKEYVYPVLKQVSGSYNAPGIIGKLAGKLCLLIPQLSNEIFSFFTENMSAKISSQFLIVVLNYPSGYILNTEQEAQVITSWVKICLLTKESTEHLTKNVLQLDYFPANLKSHLSTSRDPIYAFIEYLGSDIKQHLKSSSIIKLCELSFGHLDKWLPQYLSQPENEDVVFRIYTCMSVAFLYCGSLLYNRNKSSSPLTRLTQCLLISNDLLIGKNIHVFVVNAVKKTWHIFYEALVKLREDSDMFVERMLRDMLTKYMQYFSTHDIPITKCLENEVTAPVLLEKICSSYLKHPVKEPDANLLKVLKILTDTIQCTTSVLILKLIVKKTLFGLFEVVIFHKQRNVAISLIKTITCSPLYPQIKTEFIDEVTAVTEKHMAFNTIHYFQLMIILAKFVPSDIKDSLETIKQQVINVERLRGVGFDKNLRLHFEKLESAVRLIQ